MNSFSELINWIQNNQVLSLFKGLFLCQKHTWIPWNLCLKLVSHYKISSRIKKHRTCCRLAVKLKLNAKCIFFCQQELLFYYEIYKSYWLRLRQTQTPQLIFMWHTNKVWWKSLHKISNRNIRKLTIICKSHFFPKFTVLCPFTWCYILA